MTREEIDWSRRTQKGHRLRRRER